MNPTNKQGWANALHKAVFWLSKKQAPSSYQHIVTCPVHVLTDNNCLAH
jgi:hypothetical protein